MMNKNQFLMNKRKKNILYIINMDTTAAGGEAGGPAAGGPAAEPAAPAAEPAAPAAQETAASPETPPQWILTYAKKAQDLIDSWDGVDAQVKGYYQKAMNASRMAMEAKKAESLAKERHDDQATKKHHTEGIQKFGLKIRWMAAIEKFPKAKEARAIHEEIITHGDRWFIGYCKTRGWKISECLSNFRQEFNNPVIIAFLKLYLSLRELKKASIPFSSLGGGKRKRKRKSKRKKTQKRKKKSNRRKTYKKKSKKKRRNKTKRR